MGCEEKRGGERRGGEAVQEEECEIGEGTKTNTHYLHTWPNQCHDCVQYMLTF